MFVSLGPMPRAAGAQPLPALPQVYLNTTYPVQTGATISVPAGGDLQYAIDQAQPGDTILVEAGATFLGPFTLPNKTGDGWIIIRTSAPDSSLPPAGTRMTPAYAPLLPKLLARDTGPAIQTAPGAHHYRLTGLEVAAASGLTMNYGLVQLGDGSSAQGSLTAVPYALVLDRVYVHGRSNLNLRRGISVNSASTAVLDSHIADVHEVGADSQAIAGWNGPGPFTIVNNYLEAAGENVLFGGADPWITNLVPSDLEVRRNHFYKPLTWRTGDPSYAGTEWSVKNLFELKNARRVLIEGNLFEQNWQHAQGGTAILFTVRNQSGAAPWSTVEDVTFIHNVVRHAGSGIGMHGWDDLHPSQLTKRILIENNLFDDINSARWGGAGRLFEAFKGIEDLVIDHNTGFQTGSIIYADGGTHTRFVYRNNISLHNAYGVHGTGTGTGLATLGIYFPDYVFVKNVLVGGSPSLYPLDNFFPTSIDEVGFIDLAGGDYRLSSLSPYKNGGTDGKDIGADIDAISAAFTGVVPDTTTPVVTMTAPSAGATVADTTTVAASATDDVGVVGVRFQVDGIDLGPEDTTAPYAVAWDSRTVANGTHILAAIARDATGNTTASAGVSVTVSNDVTVPTISAVTASSITSSSATVTWTTDEASDTQVEYGPTTAYGNLSPLSTTLLTAHAEALSGLASGSLYHYRVRSRDAAGNLAVSGDFTFATAAESLILSAATPGTIRSYATIYSIGVEWDIAGDPDHDATVNVSYRIQGSSAWRTALPLVRVDFNGYNMLAGSVLFLTPDTPYEVNLDLSDPDGGTDSRTVTVRTRPLPVRPTTGRTFHVVPGAGGGDGSIANPFAGIAAAQAVAQPRDIFLVHTGNYGTAGFTRAGTSGGNYIVWKGAGDGDATFNHIDIGASYVWIEGLVIRDQTYAMFTQGAPVGVVISRNRFINCHYCIYLQQGGVDWYIADNDIVGDVDPASGSLSGEGIELNGGFTTSSGHTIAHNRITRVADGISAPYVNTDIFGNDIFDLSDDGIETDPGRANIRIWGNRIHNALHQGISFQPQEGAPWYIIRNQMVNFQENVFKFRTTDRFVLLHNTIVNWGNMMSCCIDRDDMLKAISKNNLWISVNGGPIWPMDGTTVRDWRTDLNYDGFDYGGNTSPFRYGGVTYSSLSAFSSASGLENNGILVSRTTCFATFNVPGAPPTPVPPQFMTLNSTCNAVNAGTVLPNINDGFLGSAPDLGAYELGLPLPIFGPRPIDLIGPVDITPPSIPTGLVATAVSSSQIDLTWSASTDDVGVAGYRVYRNGTDVGTANGTSYSNETGLSPLTLYVYTVAAFDAAGNTSGPSATASATTLAPPPPDLTIHRAPGTITVDGSLADWGAASAITFDGLSNGGRSSLLWDATYLYVAFTVTDAQLNSTQATRDAADLYLDDAVEVYIDTLNDRATTMQTDDYQFLVNLNNAQGDLRGTGTGKDTSWNATFTSAVTRQGTFNSNTDVDASYVVEMAIPWAQIGVTPAAGRTLSMDLVVDDRDPAGTPTYETFDWARIAPNSYSQPILWKRVDLADTPPPDTTAPSVGITLPAGGTTVAGTVTVTANASDDVGVVGVQFFVDGTPVAAEDATAPYAVAWDTTLAVDGTHALTARARDAAGNATTSVGVTVTVNNTPPAPSTPPGPATPISPSGVITTATPAFTWSAVPNVGYYLLSISDANPASPTHVWYTPAQAGCASGTGTCTVAAPRSLTSGLVSWMVLTWNTYGYGPWSTTMEAIVDGVDPLVAVPTPIAPSGAVATRTPTYEWSPLSGNITWYQLSVTDALGTTREFWYSPGQTCPSSPCAVTPNTLLAIGPAQWQVRAWSTAGAGAWTAPLAFEAASAAPGKATLIAPAGPIASVTPTFTWNGVLSTSYYLLRVTDRDNVTTERWYRPSQVGCPLGTEICTASPGIAVDPGPADWNVLTWNAAGYGPWSDTKSFSVEIADPLAAVPQPVSPNGAVATVYSTYRWTAVAGAALYRLSVRSNGGAPTQWWYTPAAAGCDTATECSTVPMSELSNGTAEWQVQAWTVNGHGNWSAAVPLTVSIPAPTVPILVSPGGSASVTPPFVWTASANATYYYVRVDDATGLRVDRWVRADQVGCLGGIGSCTLNAGVTLSSGAGSWQVIAWNPSGYSPWSSLLAFVVP